MREHLAVQIHVLLPKGVDESTVGDALRAERGVQASDPQRAVSAFFLFAMSKSVRASLHYGATSFTIKFALLSMMALSHLDEFFVSSAEGCASFNAGHEVRS